MESLFLFLVSWNRNYAKVVRPKMKNDKITSQSSDQLTQSIKTIKTIVGMLIGTSIVLLFTVLYLYFFKKNSSSLPLLIITVVSAFIAIINLKQARLMQAELDSRKNS